MSSSAESHLTRYIPIVDFLERYYRPEGITKDWKLPDPWKRVLREAFTPNRQLKLPYTTVILSARKKSIKTTVSAGIGYWFAFCMSEPMGEIIIVANKKEQAKGRAFLMIQRSMKAVPEIRAACARITGNLIETANGVRIYPITSEAGGEAGANPEIIMHDEAWAMAGVQDERLWAELTPVATRRNSIRIITSYAGWTSASPILKHVYDQAMMGEPHPDFLDMVGVDGEPVVRVRKDTRTFCYWETAARMPWQQTPDYEQYLEEQKATLFPRSEYIRLHENKWTAGEEGFNMDDWDACVDPRWDPNAMTYDGDSIGNPEDLWIAGGIDAATQRDMTAVVTFFKRDDKFWLGPWACWQPTKNQDFDLEKTVESFVLNLKAKYRLRKVYCDRYQLHRSIVTLKRRGVDIEPFEQTQSNTKLMGSNLYGALQQRSIVLPANPILRTQAAATNLVISHDGVQLKKSKRNLKIDVIVAMSMALLAAEKLPNLSLNIRESFMFLSQSAMK